NTVPNQRPYSAPAARLSRTAMGTDNPTAPTYRRKNAIPNFHGFSSFQRTISSQCLLRYSWRDLPSPREDSTTRPRTSAPSTSHLNHAAGLAFCGGAESSCLGAPASAMIAPAPLPRVLNFRLAP